MKKLSIGIDLGGTNVRFGLVDNNGKIVRQEMLSVGNSRDHASIIFLLSEGVRKLRTQITDNRSPITGVGVGAPGIVDSKNGIILRSPHYPLWHNFPLKRELSKALNVPVSVDNDANLIAAGEAWKGAGKKFKNFIMLTLGTGIGGGIIIDKKVFHGDSGFAGEIGHMVIDFNGEICDCGGRGCWENYVSIDGLKWMLKTSAAPNKEELLAATPKKLFEMAKDGDTSAHAAWKKFGAYLGAGIASLINVTGMFSYVIGGGIANAWELFINETNKELARRTYKESVERTVIKRAELGDSAGILGAASSIVRRK